MTAIHLQTFGIYCSACPHRIEHQLEELPGVRRVVVCRDVGLTSVLFDESQINVAAMQEALASAGFETQRLS